MFVHHFATGRHTVEWTRVVSDPSVQVIGANIDKGDFLLFSFTKPGIQGFLKIGFFGDTISHVLVSKLFATKRAIIN
jgi:hypothetical protein